MGFDGTDGIADEYFAGYREPKLPKMTLTLSEILQADARLAEEARTANVSFEVWDSKREHNVKGNFPELAARFDAYREALEIATKAAQELIDAAVTDSDSCAICLQDLYAHVSGCPRVAAESALAEVAAKLEKP